jgi:phage repressor protein C with HTH and peptisase S24 domain
MAIGDRLLQIRKAMNMNQTDFASMFNLAQSTYAPYEKNKRSVPDELKIMLSEKGINIHWLVTGQGKMYLDDSCQDSPTAPAPVRSKGLMPIKATDQSTSIPLLTQKLSAGPGQEWLPEESFGADSLMIPTRIVLRYGGYLLGAAEVRGDSMEPELHNGDLIIYASRMIEGNGIYALAIDGEVFVKRLEFDPFSNRLRIISDNKNSETKELPADDERITIIGKAIGRFLMYW